MYKLWLHVIRSRGFPRLKRWLSRAHCGLASDAWHGWLQVMYLHKCCRQKMAASRPVQEQQWLSVLRFKWFLIRFESLAAERSMSGSHCTLFWNETGTEVNTAVKKKNENPAWFHMGKNIVCAREWSSEIKHNVWMNEMDLSNCCLGTQVLSIHHQLTLTFCHLLFLLLDTDSPLQRIQRHVFLSLHNHGLILQEVSPRLQSRGTGSSLWAFLPLCQVYPRLKYY